MIEVYYLFAFRTIIYVLPLLLYSFNSLVIHATTLSDIYLLLSPPTMSGASEPFGTGSNRADSKVATSNSTFPSILFQ